MSVGDDVHVPAGRVIPIQSPTTALCDAFGRLRVSEPETVFYSSLTYGVAAAGAVWDTATTGTGSVVSGNSGAYMTTASSSSTVVLQTLQYHRYQPGKSQLIKVTSVMGAHTSGVTKRVGYFGASNGVFFEQSGGSYSFNIRNGGSDTSVDMANWNGEDTEEFDFAKASIIFFDIEWLGVGSVRCGIVYNGKFKVLHTFHHAGTVTTPYMQTATLPIRYEISQSGATSGALLAICSSVDSEGGTAEELGLPFTEQNSSARTATTETAILAIRPKLTFGGKTNRVTVIPKEVTAHVTDDTLIRVYMATSAITGGGWGDVNTTYSSVESNKLVTGFSTGIEVLSFPIPASGSGTNRGGGTARGIGSRIPVSLDIAGTSQVRGVVVTAQAINTTTNVWAFINWIEIH